MVWSLLRLNGKLITILARNSHLPTRTLPATVRATEAFSRFMPLWKQRKRYRAFVLMSDARDWLGMRRAHNIQT